MDISVVIDQGSWNAQVLEESEAPNNEHRKADHSECFWVEEV